MRQLALLGTIALAFGLGAYYATGRLGAFGGINLVLGVVALGVSVALALRGARRLSTPDARRVLAPPVLALLASVGGAVILERAVDALDLQLDWTFEGRYELADATRALLTDMEEQADAPGPDASPRATLFCDEFDPRCRSTWLLLRTMSTAGSLEIVRLDLDQAVEEADRFGISSSNTVVLELDGRFQTVERPSEGSLFEALQVLLVEPDRVIYVARGEGEGDFQRTDEIGYSGLAAQLEAEGFRVRDLILAHVSEIPADAAALLIVSPERGIREPAQEALNRYLEGGGRLVALLDPGRPSGLDEILEAWGFDLPDRLVVDPASGPVEGDPPGVNPIVHVYEQHPVVHRLGPTRMIFLLRARPVLPGRKPAENDRIRTLAYTSPRAWLADPEGSLDGSGAPARPADAREGYLPVVAAGEYPRGEREARIVVIGDSDFASNRYARALYNLDLALNAVHWATQQDARIVLRPKGFPPDQFPLTPQDTLRMFYGVGLLLPELLLAGAGLAWLRRRTG
ncbi:MAG: DUF4350 domain-containing protein [Myxococcota bacterium]